MKIFVRAESTLYMGMTRWRNVTSLLRPRRETIKPHTAETEVHFTPPPVPEGDAPMNIISENINIGPTLSVDMSMVLNPTVVMADIVWKKEYNNRDHKPCPSTPPGLNARIRVPTTVITPVMSNITFVVNDIA